MIVSRLFFFVFAVNLAILGTVEQQSTLIDSLGSHTAQLAVEGPANNKWEDGCSSTKANQAYVWWGLTLPKVAYITNIVIYYRGDSKLSLLKLIFFVFVTFLFTFETKTGCRVNI